MKLTVTLFFTLLLTFYAGAQKLTGIWRGYFIQKSFGYYEDRYRFEVQMEQLSNNALNGVTYSYKTTVFYGKADLKGLYTKKTNNIVFNETRLVDVKIGDHSQPCLMTCYLEYSKMGSLETLTGTYTSRNLKDGSDCGSGTVYLEKTTETDFKKEDFLLKRENEQKRITPRPPVTRVVPKTNTPTQVKPKGIKPGAEDNIVRKPAEIKAPAPKVNIPKVEPDIAVPKKEKVEVLPPPVEKRIVPKPDVIKRRSNELAKTITTSAKQIKIDLYDNGEIDGDIISVYHNNKLVVSKKQLAHSPISFKIDTEDDEGHHEFVMVAENLGSIPPNTALMVITAGDKRYELFVTSTEQKNAMVVVEYKPAE